METVPAKYYDIPNTIPETWMNKTTDIVALS